MREWGRVDILVNNAGILRDKSFAKMELADFRLVVDVHLMGAVHCTKAVWETMRAQNYGRIVMTTSSSGLYGNFGQANYGAAKMALVGLMQTLSIEGAKHDIRVNCLAPTAATRMTEKLMPEAVLRLLEAGAVTPGLLALVAEDAPTRAILCAGAGSFERAYVTLTQGIHVGHGDDAAEQIARAVRRDLRPRRRDRPRERRRAGNARDRQGDARERLSDGEPPRSGGVARRGGARASTRSPARSAPGRSGSAAGAVLDDARASRRRRRSPRGVPSGRRSSRRARRRCRRSRATALPVALMRGGAVRARR